MSNPNRQSPNTCVDTTDAAKVTDAIEASWFCRIGGTVYGPVDTQTLKRWVAENRLTKSDEIKRRVDGQYVSASWYAGLFEGNSNRSEKLRATLSVNNPHRATVRKAVANSGSSHPNVAEPKFLEKAKTQAVAPLPESLPKTVEKVKAVETTKAASDDELLRSFAEQFAARNINTFSRIGLDVKHGVVRLEGTVPTEGEYLLLIHLVRNTPGVVTIKDGIVVLGRNTANKKSKKAKSPAPSSTFLKDAAERVVTVIKSKKVINGAISVASILLVIGTAAVALQAKSLDTAPTLFPAKGTAMLNEKPIAGASIVLYRADAGSTTRGFHSRAIVDEDGRFELGTLRPQDGAPVGNYVVTIVWNKQTITNGRVETSPNRAPAKYASRETTDLKVTITKGTNQLPAFELKSE